MINEADFHLHADKTLADMLDNIESADTHGRIDAELEGPMLTLQLPGGQQYLISKHISSRQIWLSSPVSGGLHFSYTDGAWRNKDGLELLAVIRADLARLAQLEL